MNLITQWANEIAEKWIIPQLEGKKLKLVWMLSHTRRTFGNCCTTSRTETEVISRIKLSKPFILANEEPAIKFLLNHELAHIIHPNHGPGFARLLTEMTGVQVPYEEARFHQGEYEQPVGGFIYRCPACGKETKYYKRLFRERSCAECSRGRFDRRFVMIEVPRAEQREQIVVPLTEEEPEPEIAVPQFMEEFGRPILYKPAQPVMDPLEQFRATRPSGVTYKCPRCGRESTYARRLKHSRSCGSCAPGRYDPRYKMIIVPRPDIVRKELMSTTPLLNPAVAIEHYITGDTSGWIL